MVYSGSVLPAIHHLSKACNTCMSYMTYTCIPTSYPYSTETYLVSQLMLYICSMKWSQVILFKTCPVGYYVSTSNL